MKVGAFVVTHNSEDDLLACLESLSTCGLEVLVVVDNSSQDDSVSVASRFADVVIETGTNHGFGSAVNEGIGSSSGLDRYLLVNPDCLLTETAYKRLMESLDENPMLGAVVPVMQYPDESFGIAGGPRASVLKEIVGLAGLDVAVSRLFRPWLLKWYRQFGWPSLFGYLDVAPGGGVEKVDWVSGFCMLLDAQAFDSVDGFDDDFFMYFEDVDLCSRMKSAGWSVAVDREAVAQHRESVSAKAVGKSKLYRSGMATYFAKNGNRVEAWIAKRLAGAK